MGDIKIRIGEGMERDIATIMLAKGMKEKIEYFQAAMVAYNMIQSYIAKGYKLQFYNHKTNNRVEITDI